MSLRLTGPRRAVAVAGAFSVILAAGACSGGDDGGDDAGGGNFTADCAQFESFGDLSGKTVSVFAGIVTPEDVLQKNSYKPFEECTGATVQYEADKTFEAQILVRTQAGNPPDIAILPQPGLLQQLVATGKVKEAPPETVANVDEFWNPEWKTYGTVNGKFYAAPLGANVKSLVWYSPTEFQDKGLQAPTTLAELKTLSDKLAEGGRKPWCAGIGSGEATGWPVTDWLEDMMLRTAGPDVYDQWVKHEIPFNDPRVVTALDAAGAYLKNDKYVNGGLGDVKSIAGTTFQDGGLPILEATCSLHRQASFYAANWPEGTNVAEDGDVFAFYLPGNDANAKPVLGGGEFIAAFSDRPEVKAFQTYLASDIWANAKGAQGGNVVTANKGFKLEQCKCSPIDKLSIEILQDPNTVFRFDGSDLMPAAIGSNALWKQSTSWITGQSTQQTLDNVEAAWPK
jgi:alpha-glucoside transport system substrate-binding protein